MKTRQRKIFERVVNPLIIKHLVSAHGYDGKCMENANSLLEMFMYALGGMALMISGGFLMLKTQ